MGAGPFMVLAKATSLSFCIDAIHPMAQGHTPVLGAYGCLGLGETGLCTWAEPALRAGGEEERPGSG